MEVSKIFDLIDEEKLEEIGKNIQSVLSMPGLILHN